MADQLAKILQEYGFGFVKLPRPNIKVLQLLSKGDEGYLGTIGYLTDLFIQKTLPLPAIEEDKPIPNELGGLQKKNTDTKVGLSILSGYLGGETIGLNSVFNSADRIEFSFNDAVQDSVNLIGLDQFINDANVNKKAKSFSRELENSKIYIITAVLKSSSFKVKAFDTNKTEIKLDTPDIEKIIDADAHFNRSKEAEGGLVYEGNEQLVFGIKATQLKYKKERWWRRGEAGFRIKELSAPKVRGEEDYPVETLVNMETDLFIDL